MTQWIETPTGGRDRGPVGLARAWVGVLRHPQAFFGRGVSAGDQAPGLTFAMAVVAVEEATRLLLVEGAIPTVVADRWLAGLLTLAVATLLITPAALHLIAGLQTAVLVAFVPDRSGIDRTVQVIAYAAAPCALAGAPIPWLRVVVTAYGVVLLTIGLATVHGTSWWRAGVLGAPTAILVFGFGFRGLDAAMTLIGG